MADQLLTTDAPKDDSLTGHFTESTKRCPSYVHSTIDVCRLQCGRILVDAKSMDGRDTFSLHNEQILNDPRDRSSQGSETSSQLVLGLCSISVLVAALQELKHSYRPHKASRCLSVEVVESISHALQRRERQFIQPAKYSVLESFIRNEDGFAVLLTEEAKEVAKQAGVTRHLSNDLNEHEQPLGFFAICLFFCLKSSNFNCSSTGAVGGLPEPVRDDPQNRSSHNSSAPCCNRPCLPFRNAGRPQPPTLAKRVNHAHSLTPLWSRRHFAMRPRHAEVGHG